MNVKRSDKNLFEGLADMIVYGQGKRGHRPHRPPPVTVVKNHDSLIHYETLPILRTSCYVCDSCDRESGAVMLVRLRGLYRDTAIPVSYLFRTDLQSAFWSEPICLECSIGWTRRYRKSIHKKITDAARVLQRFARRILAKRLKHQEHREHQN